MKLIGDVHGQYKAYHRFIKENPGTVQVGDLGVGFRRFGGWRDGSYLSNPYYDLMVATNAWFIRGNHDNPGVCRNHKRCISDGHHETTQKGTKVMFIGGAFSIDRGFRKEGYDWWVDEELSQEEMWKFAEEYAKIKPDMMVSHDCPITAVQAMHSHHMFDNSRTQQFLQSLWNEHKPKLWVYGHHHMSFDEIIEGTQFVCLAELKWREFDV